MRRFDAKEDSTTIADLTWAYTAAKAAVRKCEEAQLQQQGLTSDEKASHEQTKATLKKTQKEVRKQKVLKWVFIGVATAVTIKSIN